MRLFASFLAAASIALPLVGATAPPAMAQSYLPAPPAPAVFVFHGQRYCFAPDGWHGPGWYWCGFAHRPGFGWGGPIGWHGWSAPGWGGWRAGWHGGSWNPRWGHGPVVFPPRGGGWRPHGGSWHPHGWHGWHGRGPSWRPHGHPHHRHGGHPHDGGHAHHGHGGHRRH